MGLRLPSLRLCWRRGRQSTRSNRMDVRQLIRPGIAASALVHLTGLALILLFSEVHPFGTVTARPITVELVTAKEAPKPPEPKQQQQLQLPKLDDVPKPDNTASTDQAAAPPSSAPQPSAQAQPSPAQPSPAQSSPAQPAEPEQSQTPPQDQPKAPEQPQSEPTPAAATSSAASSAALTATPPPAAYTPPQPDLTVKYHVMLGLPEYLPPADPAADKPGDGVDARASSAADVSANVVAAFRQHLKTCLKLPASVAPSDDVMIKLRVMMTPQGRLAAAPVLIEGTASMKGLDLKQSAVQALRACQPYDMLPPDRYREWKVLDLAFTPQDFV